MSEVEAPFQPAILRNGHLTLDARVEALLFVATEPPTVAELARALEVPVEAVEEALKVLQKCLGERGLRLQRHRDRVQLVTAPEAAEDVRRLLGLREGGRLSTAALETLAIIAYRQPITRAEIEAIRGVNCDGVLRTLLARGLIEEVGRAEGPGRPILYGTSILFLQHFGLHSLADLPPLDGAMAEEPASGT
ncbi:MAG: SMC-Scp complex subunit ScpB [Anaerolineae bacterium]|nr:SMC-Scp complex subunit ScpB [Thermoflexus sp.]MDW8064753.1 SMC-Scp complex subunit ScpB [Anaerolineae bacterium]